MNMLGLRDLILIAQTPSLHHHHHHNQNQPIPTDNNNSNLPLPSSAASLSVGFGIFPLLTATPCIPQPQNQNNDVQESSAPTNNNNNYWNLRMCPEVSNTSPKKGVINFDNDDEKVVVMSESEENGIYGAEYRVCQDCGNRAKKDCVFRRCRTCCKGRGYHCTTHVKSTWIPSVRRREREVAAVSGGGGGGGGDGGVKRPRSSQNVTTTSHSSNSNATTSKNFATSSCHQDAGFKESLPGHVKAPAVFRCHRVTAIGNGEDEFAYLATVHISGHVFKGFLYDHGVGEKNAMPCVSELQLGNNNCSGRKNGECSSAIGINNNNNNNAYPASAS